MIFHLNFLHFYRLKQPALLKTNLRAVLAVIDQLRRPVDQEQPHQLLPPPSSSIFIGVYREVEFEMELATLQELVSVAHM
jgi:hypothetical protein